MKKSSRLVAGGAALAVTFVGAWEGVRLAAYRDVIGVPTVCFGETRGVKMGDKYTLAECKDMFGKRLEEFALEVDKCLVNPKAIPDKPYVAFLSLAYNIGSGGFCKSSVARKANAGDLVGACNALPLFNKAGGRVVKGLVNRRAAERKMCLEGLKK